MRKITALLIPLLLLTTITAYGPAKVASIDRSVVPIKITNRKAFNAVSHLEICFFVTEMTKISTWKEREQFQQFLSRDNINMASIKGWIKTTQKRVISRYNASLADQLETPWDPKQVPQKLNNWAELSHIAKHTVDSLPPAFALWRAQAKGFYKTYLFEQVRLAALFPAITSEIHTLDSIESQGFEYEDGTFLLTFDDGPTPAGGHTDKLIAQLNKQQISAIFFALGEKLQREITTEGVEKLRKRYKGHRLESHGYVHKAHPKYSKWQTSLTDTRDMIERMLPSKEPAFYRPPYGQRSREQISHLQHTGEQVMLWNIDSQDWNRTITAPVMSDRVITLMLLWRSGILLFHDIHPKVQLSLPALTEFVKKAELHWINGSTLKNVGD